MDNDNNNIRVISNCPGDNHEALLRNQIQNCESAVLVSPFLFPDFSDWLSSLELSNLKEIILVTTISPRGDDQLRKPESLISFYDTISTKYPNMKVTIQVNNDLHGKVYLFKTEEIFTHGIVTSANLTRHGLTKNHEWGVLVAENAVLSELWQQISSTVKYPLISRELLEKMKNFVDFHLSENPDALNNKGLDIGLESVLEKAPKISRNSSQIDLAAVRDIFLKPWGTKDKPVHKVDKRPFGSIQGSLDFPKGKPSDVKTGDLVVCFGTGSRCVLAVYQVLSNPTERSKELQKQDKEAERWPWFVHGQNLTPIFGNSWWERDLTIDVLVEQFLSENGGVAITAAEGDSLGAIQFGAGRLKLSREFGEYVVQVIFNMEERTLLSEDQADAQSTNTTVLEEQFHSEMLKLYNRAKDEAKYRASVFITMLESQGGLATARQLINSPTVSDGYTALWEKHRLDLTVEAFVLENEKYHPLFSAGELNSCKGRLDEYDYLPR